MPNHLFGVIPRFTKEELADLCKQVQAITIKGLPVFRVNIIDKGTDEPIALNDITESGAAYLAIETWANVGNFDIYITVPDPEAAL